MPAYTALCRILDGGFAESEVVVRPASSALRHPSTAVSVFAISASSSVRLSRPRSTTTAPPRPDVISGHRACLPLGQAGRGGRRRSLPTFTANRYDGVGVSSVPVASPGPQIAVLDLTSRRPTEQPARVWTRTPNTSAALQTAHPPDSTRPLTSHGASAADSLALGLPSSLAGTRRLVVPTRPYVVRAAPSLAPDPGSSLPSASTDRCDDQRRSPFIPHGQQRLVAHLSRCRSSCRARPAPGCPGAL
jgi:hypothetical protein